MEEGTESRKIAEIRRMRFELRIWRWCLFGWTLVLVIGCLLYLRARTNALAQEGPEQEQFVTELQQNLDHDVVPHLQNAAGETLTELQPEVRNSITKLKDHLPELTELGREQFDMLRTELPKRGEAVLNESFNTILTQREGTIRKAYPNVTDDQLRLFVTNFGEMAKEELTNENQALFAPHQKRLMNIMDSMEAIKKQEYESTKKIEPSWDMAILLLDIFRDDLKKLQSSPSKSNPNMVQQHAVSEGA